MQNSISGVGVSCNNVYMNAEDSNNVKFRANETKLISDEAVQSLKEKYNGNDGFVSTISKEEQVRMSEKEQKELIKKAKITAAGWSIFGSPFSTLYYGLRSDKTIAEKYNLDVEKDNKLIKKIRDDQVNATLPGILLGGGGLISYLYNKNMDSSKIELYKD